MENDELIDGDGFLGIVDPNLISSFRLTSDDLEISSTFEDFEMDEILFALTVCPESAPPAPDVIGSDVVTKNRYLSFSAGTAGASQAIRVSFDALPPPFHVWNSSTMWVGPVSAVSESPGSVVPIPGFPTFNAAQLQCAPHFDDWTQYGVIHTFHEGVVPGGGYTIQVIDATCDLGSEASFSAPLGLPTAIFGDAVKDCNTLPCPPPNGAVDIIDCFAIIQRFVGVSTAIGKARADLEPSCVDLAMNILDVFQCINAINGFGYPFGTTLASPCASKCGNPLP